MKKLFMNIKRDKNERNLFSDRVSGLVSGFISEVDFERK